MPRGKRWPFRRRAADHCRPLRRTRGLARQRAGAEAIAEIRNQANELDEEVWVEEIRFETLPPVDLEKLRAGGDLWATCCGRSTGWQATRTNWLPWPSTWRRWSKAGPESWSKPESGSETRKTSRVGCDKPRGCWSATCFREGTHETP